MCTQEVLNFKSFSIEPLPLLRSPKTATPDFANHRTRMTPSTPKRRRKSDPKNPNFKPHGNIPDQSPSSSSSTITSLLAEVEPPPNLLPSKSEFLKLIVVITIAAAVAAACNFLVSVFNHTPKPFCDSNVEFDDSVSDLCVPCPSNGRCYNGQLECIQGYRKHGKLCIEDGDINERAKRLSEWVKNRLCEAHAQYICAGTGTIWVSDDNLMNMLEDHGLIQSSTMDKITSEYIKERAVEDIVRLLDTRTTIDGVKEFKCPDILAASYQPMTCRFRHWIAEHRLFLIPVCALLVGCTLLLLRIRRRWYLRKRAEQLYHQVCDILEENTFMSKSASDKEPWLVASRLRDHLLSPRERRDPHLWTMVEELVELDTRLDCYPKLVKGESKVVWEWQVEGCLSSSRRRKKVEINNPNDGADINKSSDQK